MESVSHWLSDSILDYEILPSEYVIYRNDRSSCDGGGVLVAIKNHLPSCLISSPSHIEILCENIGILGYRTLDYYMYCIFAPKSKSTSKT